MSNPELQMWCAWELLVLRLTNIKWVCTKALGAKQDLKKKKKNKSKPEMETVASTSNQSVKLDLIAPRKG